MERVTVTFKYINNDAEPVNPGSGVGTTTSWETGIKSEYTWTDVFTYVDEDAPDAAIIKKEIEKKHSGWTIISDSYTFSYEDVDLPDIDFEDDEEEDLSKLQNTPSLGDLLDEATPEDEIVVDIPEAQEKTDVDIVDEIVNQLSTHITWDPRLFRRDEYFEIPEEEVNTNKQNNKTGMVIRAPFASNTIASAFADLSNVMEGGIVKTLFDNKQLSDNSPLGKYFATMKKSFNNESTIDDSNSVSKNLFENADITDKFIVNDTKKMEEDGNLWASQSLINPYSVTKLIGGIDKSNDGFINYMYDIRDQRRFYDVNGSSDILSVSNPTITQLIKWSNQDLWGRTPYSFQDFVYCKYFGLIPNNRLITLRRYSVPTYDNLQFENMNGAHEQVTVDANGKRQTEKSNEDNLVDNTNPQNKLFTPHAYVVTWFGGETGNSLNNLMSFTTGINWDEVQAKVWDVQGEDGETKQAVIDRLLENGGMHTNLFGGAEQSMVSRSMEGISFLTSKITSFGKLYMATEGDIGMNQDAYNNLRGAMVDPYEATFRNRVKGPINRIDAVKKRKEGIVFSQSLAIKCSYQSKSIGGINPKAALLDILGNCLEMVSPHAIFWGGGHRFQVKPQLYPFHDGGWRDNFMAKIYDGKFLGKDGAIATVLSGLKKVGENESGIFNMETAKSIFAQLGGGMLNMVGNAINSISDVLGGVDFLSNVGNFLNQKGGATQSQGNTDALKNRINTLFGNIRTMWQNRMIAETALPHITAGGNLLVGEPTGEWHLTIGNPFNPIMVVGNLICKDMKVDWDEELGPDDFPIGFSVTYTLEHAMARDSDAIQSMFNRGMGKFYTLPDYMKTSSDRITYVDNFTNSAGSGDVGDLPYKMQGSQARLATQGYMADSTTRVDPGKPNPMVPQNYNTQLITKFNGIETEATRSVMQRQRGGGTGVISRVRSLASTRKLTNN